MIRDPLSKKYYKIREVAEILELPMSTLRFWEKEFPRTVRPRRNASGTRFYTPDDIEALRRVKFLLRDRGMHLEAARAELATNSDGVSRRTLIIERLKAVRKTLRDLQLSMSSRRP